MHKGLCYECLEEITIPDHAVDGEVLTCAKCGGSFKLDRSLQDESIISKFKQFSVRAALVDRNSPNCPDPENLICKICGNPLDLSSAFCLDFNVEGGLFKDGSKGNRAVCNECSKARFNAR